MKNDKKKNSERYSDPPNDPEGLFERYVQLIADWAASSVALMCVLLCLPFFAVVDLYRWFKFNVLRRNG